MWVISRCRAAFRGRGCHGLEGREPLRFGLHSGLPLASTNYCTIPSLCTLNFTAFTWFRAAGGASGCSGAYLRVASMVAVD